MSGSLTNRTDGFIEQITNLFTNIPTNVEGIFLSIGNGLWGGAAWLVQKSTGVDMASKFGPFINRFVGTIYTTITTGWMIPAMLIVFVIMGAASARIWTPHRRAPRTG